MRVKAPFQGQNEHAGQGYDGRHFYTLVRFTLRAYIPFHDPKGQPRLWKRPFVWQDKPIKMYE